MIDSPYLRELGQRNARNFPGTEDHFVQQRHWIVVFHDETLEVIGDSVTCLGVEGAASAADAISQHAV